MSGVRRSGGRGLDTEQRLTTAELLELRRPAQLLGHSDRVDRLAPAVQAERRVVDRTVRRLVEVG